MPFEFDSLEKRFEHIPTDLHQFEEKHQAVISELVSTAKNILEQIPYGQEAEDVINILVQAGKKAHEAIDKTPHPGAIVVGGKVVQEPIVEPVEDPTVGTMPAPVVAPAAPVSEPESKLEHFEHEIEDLLHVGQHAAQDTSVVLGDAADAIADPA